MYIYLIVIVSASDNKNIIRGWGLFHKTCDFFYIDFNINVHTRFHTTCIMPLLQQTSFEYPCIGCDVIFIDVSHACKFGVRRWPINRDAPAKEQWVSNSHKIGMATTVPDIPFWCPPDKQNKNFVIYFLQFQKQYWPCLL